MPLTLTLDKTPIIDPNRVIAAAGTDDLSNAAMMSSIVSRLLALASGAPTCRGSSNGIGTGALDGVNRFGTVWAASGNHGWIVLDFGIGELCIDLLAGSTSTHLITAVWSPSAGFTGGSATARPTATDEQVLISGGAWGGNNGADVQQVFHIIHASDGSYTRVYICRGGVVSGVLRIETVKNPRGSWATNQIAAWVGSAGSTPQATVAIWNGGAQFKGATTGMAATYGLTGEAYNGQLVGQAWGSQNTLDSAWDVGSIGVFSATATKQGRHGEIYDCWWVPSGLTDGDTMANNGASPASSHRDFAVFGDFLEPWTGDATTVTTS